MEALLLDSIAAPEDAKRLAAAHWAQQVRQPLRPLGQCKHAQQLCHCPYALRCLLCQAVLLLSGNMNAVLQLYAFDHVPARYIGFLAAGDAKLEVAEAGKAALRPPKPAAAGAYFAL